MLLSPSHTARCRSPRCGLRRSKRSRTAGRTQQQPCRDRRPTWDYGKRGKYKESQYNPEEVAGGLQVLGCAPAAARSGCTSSAGLFSYSLSHALSLLSLYALSLTRRRSEPPSRHNPLDELREQFPSFLERISPRGAKKQSLTMSQARKETKGKM